ncbi:MAG TPA: hypothetical protein VF355_05655 [Anaerolineaceae bacterium]
MSDENTLVALFQLWPGELAALGAKKPMITEAADADVTGMAARSNITIVKIAAVRVQKIVVLDFAFIFFLEMFDKYDS